MNKKEFHQIAQELGLVNTDFKKKPLEYSGELLGYPVDLSLVEVQTFTSQIKLVIYISETLNKNELQDLKNELKAKKIKAAYSTGEKSIVFTLLKIKKHEGVETINELMSIADSMLQRFNVNQDYRCPACNENNCDTLLRYNNRLEPVHEACIPNLVENHAAELEEKDANSNYLLGTLGAIIGGILATLPTIITIQVFNWEFAMLYILIPFGIIWGYQTFKGKSGPYLLLLSIVLSIILTLALWIVVTHLSIVDYYGSYITFADTWEFITMSDNLGYLLKDSIFGIICVIIGIAASWKWAMNTSSKQIKELHSATATTLPYKGRAEI